MSRRLTSRELRLELNICNLKNQVLDFTGALNQNSINSASLYAYQIVENAVISVIDNYRSLDEDQRDFFDSMAMGSQICFEDVRDLIERPNSAFEIARTYVHPLFFAIGIFGELSEDPNFISILPQLRSVLLVHALRHIEKDPDINAETLLPLACQLYENIQDRDTGGAISCLRAFVDQLNSNLGTENIGDLLPLKDPLIRLTEEEIATMLQSIRRGYAPLRFPPFKGGPRLQRLKRRIAAIEGGDISEIHLLPILLKISSKLEDLARHAVESDSEAKLTTPIAAVTPDNSSI